MLNGRKLHEKIALMLVIMGLLVCMYFSFFCKTKNNAGKIKVGLILSPSVPYQLKQNLLRSVNSRENMAVLCISTGYRVFDNDRKTSTAREKIEQLIDVGANAVGLVYLNEKEQKECLKLLSARKIPSFVMSQNPLSDTDNADYFCYNDPGRAANIASRYIYNIVEDKTRVAVVTDTRKNHEKMALAFSNQYCSMAKMNGMSIYAVNLDRKPNQISSALTGESLKTMPFRDFINSGRIRFALPLCDYNDGGTDANPYCIPCDKFWPLGFTKCPTCGATLVHFSLESVGEIKREDNIESAIRKIENSDIEALYVIGDVAPVIAYKHISRDWGRKGTKLIATGSELLTLAAINRGLVTANVEPDWLSMGDKFITAINSHFEKELYAGKDPMAYMVKDYQYYNDNCPAELPAGKGARENSR